MGEKNILAYFHSPAEAESIVPKLRALRVAEVSVDRIGELHGAEVGQSVNPVTGSFPGLAYLTLGSDNPAPIGGVMAAASVDASGLSNGGEYDEENRLDTIMTVIVDEHYEEQALRVIREAGGKI
ncbi:hypothetical protein [Paenibacillus rigui]|uniref:Uncharacterized protein n=1 Tax=Paenibacillus rigui TaxID=554312 RepID=A0A229USL7_9BACL|nr:hypothetical protein [Paenibacillus rigui]OXM86125.1 hypothetical protein CF651_12990 [Paenibacillus rigui]